MCLFWRIFTFLAIALAAFADVTIENGGYGNILVSFKQNIQTNNPLELVETLKSSFNDASEILRSAVGLRFSKVTFLLPQAWDVSEWNLSLGHYSRLLKINKADIVIDGTSDTVFGKLPFTEQYGDCGTPGYQINILESFLLDQNSPPKGQILAREWLKYRYGVFDENGYPEDQLYPLFHNLPVENSTKIDITDCTNSLVEYNLKGKDETSCGVNGETTRRLATGECFIEPDEKSIENVTSSLLYFHEKFQNMRHVCGKEAGHKHSSRSQNKHNALCYGKSIWDVIKTSKDFGEGDSTTEGEIEYTYIQEEAPKIVIAWEYTTNMKQGKTVISAVKKFIYDLPNGSQYAAFPFIDTPIDKAYSLKELKDWPNDRKTDYLSNFAKPGDGCIHCALEKAVEILSASNPGESKLEGNIIMIVASSNLELKEDLIEKLKNSNLLLTFVVFGSNVDHEKFDPYTSALIHTAQLKDLSAVENELQSFKLLFEAMETHLPETTADSVTKTVETDYLPREPMRIRIDSTIEKVTFWVLGRKEPDYMEFMFNDKEVNMNEEVSSEIMAFSYTPSEEGVMTFKFKYLYEKDDTLTQVTVTSKQGQYMTLDTFFRDTTEDGTSQQMPLILYARLRFGSYPVQNADVSAVIQKPDGEKIELIMLDDGTGDPDITKDDGFYSRYFTSFSEKGQYNVTITAKSKEQVSTYGKILKAKGYQSCCGSFVERGLYSSPEFTKNFTAVFDAISGRPEEGYKPSRILDLRIDTTSDGKIILKWTAPGAEADNGTVEAYEIKCFTSQEDAVLNFDSGILINNNHTTPSARGTTETFEANLDVCGNSGVYYIAMRAKISDKVSNPSKVIEVFIPERETTINDDTTTKKPEDTKLGSANKKLIWIIVGIILAVVVIVIIIYVVVYCLIIKPKRKQVKKKPTNQNGNPSTENNVINPINFISADTLIKHHNEKTKAKNENKDPPIFKEEDFQNDNSNTRHKAEKSNNAETPGYSQINKQPKNVEPPLPPKSPKRTTYV